MSQLVEGRMHDDQVDISLATAEALVAAQFPELADLPVVKHDSPGTMNAIVRIGDTLAARFPMRLQPIDDVTAVLESEVAAIRRMAEISPIPVPEVVGIGRAGPGFPMPWTIQTWLPGRGMTSTSHAASIDCALGVADLIVALRAGDVRGETFTGNGRGGDLTTHDAWVRHCLDKSGDLLNVALLERLWRKYRQLGKAGSDVLNHGDLTPANLLVNGDQLAGVLDTGGFAAADPALDLVAAWHLFDTAPRDTLRCRIGCDDLEWDRGKAWAFQQALGAFWYYLDTNQPMAEVGAWTLLRIVADETGDDTALAPPTSRVWPVLGGPQHA